MSSTTDSASSVPPLRGLQPDGWFREESTMWPGQGASFKVKNIVHTERTQFQDLAVFDNEGPCGRVMVLDGAIQLTELDEFVYHEMMAHVPLLAHPNPKTVLIVGGGDGGVLREVLRHSTVERCDLVDIDGSVIEASKQFFPSLASAAFANPRASVTVGDGAAFVASKEAAYDVIIVDSSDPEGPASVLFGVEFYQNVRRALKPGGIVCSQGESIWLHRPLIERMLAMLRSAEVGFTGGAAYGMIYIPTYPCGSIGCLLARKVAPEEGASTFPLAVRSTPADIESAAKYYTDAIHKAAFVLPKFAAHLNVASV